MLPVSTPAKTRNVSGKNHSFFRRKVEWLFSPELFHLKLLVGTAVGVLVIIVLAVTCVVFTFRHQQRDELRAHTIAVTRLSSVVENDIAALENAASQPSAYEGWRLPARLRPASGAFSPTQQGTEQRPCRQFPAEKAYSKNA